MNDKLLELLKEHIARTDVNAVKALARQRLSERKFKRPSIMAQRNAAKRIKIKFTSAERRGAFQRLASYFIPIPDSLADGDKRLLNEDRKAFAAKLNTIAKSLPDDEQADMIHRAMRPEGPSQVDIKFFDTLVRLPARVVATLTAPVASDSKRGAIGILGDDVDMKYRDYKSKTGAIKRYTRSKDEDDEMRRAFEESLVDVDGEMMGGPILPDVPDAPELKTPRSFEIDDEVLARSRSRLRPTPPRSPPTPTATRHSSLMEDIQRGVRLRPTPPASPASRAAAEIAERTRAVAAEIAERTRARVARNAAARAAAAAAAPGADVGEIAEDVADRLHAIRGMLSQPIRSRSGSPTPPPPPPNEAAAGDGRPRKGIKLNRKEIAILRKLSSGK